MTLYHQTFDCDFYVGDVREVAASLEPRLSSGLKCSRFLIQLERSEFLEKWLGFDCKFFGHSLEFGMADVFGGGTVLSTKLVNRQANLDLSFLALYVRQDQSKQAEGFLLNDAETEIGYSPSFALSADYFRCRQERVNKVDRFAVGHGEFKTYGVTLSDAMGGPLPLNSDVAFRVNHASQIPQVPLFHDLLPASVVSIIAHTGRVGIDCS